MNFEKSTWQKLSDEYNNELLPRKKGSENLDNWEAAEIKQTRQFRRNDPWKKKRTAEKAGKENLAESLILAQDERWRRA